MRHIAALGLLALVAGLCACGQKGPLVYRDKHPAPTAVASPADTPADAQASAAASTAH